MRETVGEGTGDQLRAFLRDQLGTRSLTPRDGDDPDAILSRAEAAVKSGELDAALGEIDNLPDSGKAVLEEWTVKAVARKDALSAFETLESALNEN